MSNRAEYPSRKIKRNLKAHTQVDTSFKRSTRKYQFYRQITYPFIVRMKNERDKLNHSLWLTRLDQETSDLKIRLIKILFISLNNYQYFNIFLIPPPDNLSDLNLETDNTMEIIENLQNNVLLTNENTTEEYISKRSVAVATDMCSYSMIKTSRYLVQSFYARSDFPIYTWHNPSNIVMPNNISYNQWEAYLNRSEILSQNKYANNNEANTNKCENIINSDQVSKEVALFFRWHPHSMIYSDNKPKLSASYIEVDQDIANQLSNQPKLDKAAFGIVHNKSFPGYKMLDPRIYSTLLKADQKFFHDTTRVQITDKYVSTLSATNGKPKKQSDKFDEQILKQRKNSPIACCINTEKSLNKLNNTKCTKQQLPYSKKIIKNEKAYSLAGCSKQNKTDEIENNMLQFERVAQNKTYHGKQFCNTKYKNTDPKCSNKSASRAQYEHNKSSKRESKTNLFCLSNSNQSCITPRKPSFKKNHSKAQNNYSNHLPLNDSSNYDWTMSSDEISSDKNVLLNNTSIYDTPCRNNLRLKDKCIKGTSVESKKRNIRYNNNKSLKTPNTTQNNLDQSPRQPHMSLSYEKQQSYKSKIKSPHLQTSINGCINKDVLRSFRKSNTRKHSKTRHENNSQSNYFKKMYKNVKPNKENKYQNNSYPSTSEFKSSTKPIKNSNENDHFSGPVYDEKWDPDVRSYSAFEHKHLCCDNERKFLTSERKRRSFHRTSLHDLSNNFSSPSDKNYNSDSDWSVEIGPNFSKLTNSTSSLTTINSESGFIEQNPDYNPATIDCYQSDPDIEINESWSQIPQDTDSESYDASEHDYINNFNTSHRGFKESDLRNNYSNIENVQIPNISYETSYSDNYESNDDYSDIEKISMPNINYETSYSDSSMSNDDHQNITDRKLCKNNCNHHIQKYAHKN